MTAAALLGQEIARRLRGRCVPAPGGGLLAKDGARHADCSTCFAACGDLSDMGLADKGFVLEKDHEGLSMRWSCPGCGGAVHELTSTFEAQRDAEKVAGDALCASCRRASRGAA